MLPDADKIQCDLNEERFMKPEQVAELLEKLIDEKLKLATILNSKTLGQNKMLFLDDCRKQIGQLKLALVAALKAES